MQRSLNLMTHQAVRRRITAEAVWLWSRLLLVLAVLAGGAGALKAWQREETRQQTVALTAQHQPVQQLRNDLQVLRARINAVQQNEKLALGIASTPRVLAVLAGVTQAAAEFRGEAYVAQLDYECSGPMADRQLPRRITIEGVARDPAAIQRFVAALRSSGRFHEVELGETEAQLLRGTATTAFEVDCVL